MDLAGTKDYGLFSLALSIAPHCDELANDMT